MNASALSHRIDPTPFLGLARSHVKTLIQKNHPHLSTGFWYWFDDRFMRYGGLSDTADAQALVRSIEGDIEAADPYNAPRFSLADLAAMIGEAAPADHIVAEAYVGNPNPSSWHYVRGSAHAREYIVNQIADRLDSRSEAERFRLDAFPKSAQAVTQ